MPRVTQDFDFKIHVDPSCLGAPMDEDTVEKADIECQSKALVLHGDQRAETEEASDLLSVKSDNDAAEVEEDDDDDAPDPNANYEAAEAAEDDTNDNAVEAAEDNAEDNAAGIEEDNGDEAPHISPDHDAPEAVEDNDDKVPQTSPDHDAPDAEGDDDGDAGEDHDISGEVDDEDTPMPTQIHEEHGCVESEADTESRRESTATDRRTSGRTEALIQAAARAVVARIESRHNVSETHHTNDGDLSVLSRTSHDTYGLDGTELSYAAHAEYLPRVSEGHMLPAPAGDDAGDSSSHHELDDDVFSDPSPRSSTGSTESEPERKPTMDEVLSQATRSPRISDFSQYEDEEFVPTARGTPRPPFRTPSSVRAMQLSSPTASVFGSPRSTKRSHLPTISRLGSPTVSAQYSPKGRSTPPRFKSRKEAAPLVLLHVTLLPLRWPWASVLESAATEQLSESAKNLREAWRHLQDRMGDTVLERGVLLPHPQNDYEVLEERLLEAMDLPLRRRARILECGHYLGPANELSLSDDLDSEDEDADARSTRSGFDKKTHWCGTCRHDIKYDSLGPGKVFRVKVYASNGLMKAGAWEACWKEMERVDVEIEPILEASLQEELGRLAAEQHQLEEETLHAHETSHGQTMVDSTHVVDSSPIPEIHVDEAAIEEDRRRREQERLREIYGHTPPPPHTRQPPSSSSSMHPHPDSYIPPPSPPSPSEEAYERRETRRKTYQTASLPELLLEVAKVLMRDRKNVIIAVLSLLAMMLAIRGSPPEDADNFAISRSYDAPAVVVVQQPAAEHAETTVSPPTPDSVTTSVPSAAQVVPSMEVVPSVQVREAPPVQQASVAPDPEISKEVIRVVETVTETVKVTATETHVHTVAGTVDAKIEEAPEGVDKEL